MSDKAPNNRSKKSSNAKVIDPRMNRPINPLNFSEINLEAMKVTNLPPPYVTHRPLLQAYQMNNHHHLTPPEITPCFLLKRTLAYTQHTTHLSHHHPTSAATSTINPLPTRTWLTLSSHAASRGRARVHNRGREREHARDGCQESMASFARRLTLYRSDSS